MSGAPAIVRRRIVAAGPGLLGLALATRPERLVSVACGSSKHPASWIVRVLGARMAGQAAVTAARPTLPVALAGIGTDLSHAASMVWVSRRYPEYRRAALASASVATAAALASIATL